MKICFICLFCISYNIFISSNFLAYSVSLAALIFARAYAFCLSERGCSTYCNACKSSAVKVSSLKSVCNSLILVSKSFTLLLITFILVSVAFAKSLRIDISFSFLLTLVLIISTLESIRLSCSLIYPIEGSIEFTIYCSIIFVDASNFPTEEFVFINEVSIRFSVFNKFVETSNILLYMFDSSSLNLCAVFADKSKIEVFRFVIYVYNKCAPVCDNAFLLDGNAVEEFHVR
jgi:hypothetical protein